MMFYEEFRPRFVCFPSCLNATMYYVISYRTKVLNAQLHVATWFFRFFHKALNRLQGVAIFSEEFASP